MCTAVLIIISRSAPFYITKGGWKFRPFSKLEQYAKFKKLCPDHGLRWFPELFLAQRQTNISPKRKFNEATQVIPNVKFILHLAPTLQRLTGFHVIITFLCIKDTFFISNILGRKNPLTSARTHLSVEFTSMSQGRISHSSFILYRFETTIFAWFPLRRGKRLLYFLHSNWATVSCQMMAHAYDFAFILAGGIHLG